MSIGYVFTVGWISLNMPVTNKDINTDWQRNWHASLATKITGPILWGIVLVSVVVAIITQSGTRNSIEGELNTIADTLSYRLSQELYDASLSEELVRSKILENFDSNNFSAIEIRYSAQSIKVGETSSTSASIIRQLIIHDMDRIKKNINYELLLYHAPMTELVKNERKKALLYIGLPFLLLGAFLVAIVHIIVIRPIKEMVNATHKVSEGDMSIRLESERIDEFGELQKFFNHMLDRLEDNHIELKDAFEDAQSANKAKSAFLANMSHELRTPLNAILGYNDLVKESLEEIGISQCTEDAEKITSSAKHLLTLINEVLDLSKIESGKMEFHIEEFSLNALIEDIVSTTQLIIRTNNNRLEMDFSDELGLVHTDQTKLSQILLNLISNAAKFTQNGNIELTTEFFSKNSNPWFRVKVTDSGIGMTPEQCEKVFKDFVQADSGTTKRFGGTGLGLSITRRLCELLGGSILLDSKLGEGTTFTIELPQNTDDFFCPLPNE